MTVDDADKPVASREELDGITEKIIACAYAVGGKLGYGFLEKVYENSMTHEIRKTGLEVLQQHPVRVTYDGVVVGDYVADLLVAGTVIVELKAARALDTAHLAQCLNYLKATGLRVCLLVNFSEKKVEVKRVVNNF